MRAAPAITVAECGSEWSGRKAGESGQRCGLNSADAWHGASLRAQCKCRLCEAGLQGKAEIGKAESGNNDWCCAQIKQAEEQSDEQFNQGVRDSG